jgi:hypothetical protein
MKFFYIVLFLSTVVIVRCDLGTFNASMQSVHEEKAESDNNNKQKNLSAAYQHSSDIEQELNGPCAKVFEKFLQSGDYMDNKGVEKSKQCKKLLSILYQSACYKQDINLQKRLDGYVESHVMPYEKSRAQKEKIITGRVAYSSNWFSDWLFGYHTDVTLPVYGTRAPSEAEEVARQRTHELLYGDHSTLS